MLDNSIDRDQVACYIRLNDVNSTYNNQPWKLQPALGSQPGSILTFQDLIRLTDVATRLAVQKTRTPSWGQPEWPNAFYSTEEG